MTSAETFNFLLNPVLRLIDDGTPSTSFQNYRDAAFNEGVTTVLNAKKESQAHEATERFNQITGALMSYRMGLWKLPKLSQASRDQLAFWVRAWHHERTGQPLPPPPGWFNCPDEEITDGVAAFFGMYKEEFARDGSSDDEQRDFLLWSLRRAEDEANKVGSSGATQV